MPKSIRIPLLLRRGLAQLRGDPPAGWPNVTRTETPEPGAPYGSELYGPHYPFPTLARTMPHLGKRATQAQLRRMIERLETARIGTHGSSSGASRREFPSIGDKIAGRNQAGTNPQYPEVTRRGVTTATVDR